MQFFKDLSIGQKLVTSFIVILLLTALLSLFSNQSLSRMNGDITRIVDINQPAATQALQLSAALSDSSQALGFYIVTQEAKDLDRYEKSITRLKRQLGDLGAQPAIKNTEEYRQKLETIAGQIDEIDRIEHELIKMASDPNSNMPAMQFSADNINPQYRNRLQLLSSMLEFENDEEASEERRELANAIVGLRYYWTTINNELRLFLAFRTQVATDNARVYIEAAKGKHADLMDLEDRFTFEQADAMEQFNDGLDSYWDNIEKLFEIHNAEDWRGDAFLLRTQVAPALNQIDEQLSALVTNLQQDSRQAASESAALYQSQQTQMILLMTVVLVFLALLAWLLTRGISRPLKQAVAIADQIANGNLNNQIDAASRDETGELLITLARMQTDLRNRIEADAKTASANLRIRQALDNVSTSVTVSNDDNDLIYLNHAAEALMRSLETGIRENHPDFSVDQLLGKKLSTYLDDPNVRAAYEAMLKEQSEYDTIIAERNLHLVASPVYDEQGSYQGRVTQWRDVTEQLRAEQEERERIAAERVVAAENARIRTALDNVSSNVMLADNERNIIYMNRNVTRLFTDSQEQLRQELPQFDPENLLGSNIDQFHKHPPHQAQLLENLTSTYETEMKVGGLTMKIVANPVISEDGERLGTAVEWSDRTQEVAVEQEIDALVDAASNGDLARRIELDGKDGFFRQLSLGFNSLLDQLSSVFTEIAGVMSRMAEGDLSQNIQQQYHGTFGSVRDDINKTLDNLSEVLNDMTLAADDISSTSGEISSGNTNLSSRTEQQAASLEQTAASMEELTSTVRNNAENAQQANQVATTARQSAEKGGAVVSDAIVAMNEISQSSNKIAEIIGVIDEIAFQTNLLALNASVEAARAGEQGRGFAVVATEVRNLASRSAEAAKEIKALIQDSLGKVNSGTELVNQSGQTLGEIVEDVKKVGDIVAEIAASSVEQSAGIDQVNQAVTSMDELTQQNAALAEQTSAASANMMDKAAQMAEMAGFFNLEGQDDTAAPQATASIDAESVSQAAVDQEGDDWQSF